MDQRVWHAGYDPGVPPSVAFQATTLPEFLRESTSRFPNRTAIRFMNATLTYAELDEQVDQFANALRDLGVVKGDRVAIQLPNLPQTVIAFYGTLRAGAVAVMTNPMYTPRELIHQWNDAECRVAVTADFLFADRIQAIRDQLPVREWVIASIPEYLRFPLNLLAPFKLRKAHLIADVPNEPCIRRFRAMLAASSARPATGAAPEPTTGSRDAVTMEDLAALQYTGGTTGVSKGAMLTHANLSHQVQQLSAWLPNLEPGNEVFLGALPFFHVFGLSVAMNLAVSIGAEMVLLPNPRELRRMIDSINKYRVSVFPIVPAMVNGINAHPHVHKLNVGSLKICVSGSAPLAEDTLRRFEELTGGTLVEGYGLTEASPVTHVNPTVGPRRIGHIGLPLPDTDCRIVSANDNETDVPNGEPGELLIRGPQVMRGYWNRPDATATTIRDGWLHTGDLATMDEHGYFRIVGRQKEMIVVGGYNVYPDEVDGVLMDHPSVLECATIGVPDARVGESVKSFVVLHPGKKATGAELEAFCRKELAAYKVPREIEFRTDLPKSSVLKILRRELAAEELRKREAAGRA
ncbi:MAG: long-chain-fatty-acid--CoA ligase [Gemmatimonadota bacterium]|nr:MAG: long-chain-fatty-acid--CoA ligase [Gemmatimonadota bacterium]